MFSSVAFTLCSMCVGSPLKGTRAPTAKNPEDSSDSEAEEEVKEYSGEIEIPNLSEENDMDEVDVSVKGSK